MPASDEATRTRELCGKWMPRAKDYCARTPDHRGIHRPPDYMQRQRARVRAADRPYDPEAARRWKAKHNIARYGLTPDTFAKMLADQGHACGMCLVPFAEDQRICVDHDHNLGCHPGEKQACDKCRRGLLCVSCNTALGHIETRYTQARQYLKRWQGGVKMLAGRIS
jgi:hypothetical protein